MDGIPRKEQGAQAKLCKVPAKAERLICDQQIKHRHSVKQEDKKGSPYH